MKKKKRRGGKLKRQKREHERRMEKQKKIKKNKKSSLLNQTQQAFRKIDGIGLSKRETRFRKETLVHSYSQQRHNKSNSKQFVTYLKKEYGIKNLNEITYRHYVSFIEKKLYVDKVSPAHVRNIETSLMHLQIGLKKMQIEKNENTTVFFNERLVTNVSEINQNRSYSDEEYKKIHDNLKGEYQIGVFLARYCGLRAKEIQNIEVRHFLKTYDNYVISIPDGSGITKGGRPRELFISREHTVRLDKILNGKGYFDKVCDIKNSQLLRNAVLETKKRIGLSCNDGKGLHGFRHSFARERMNQYIQHKEGAEEIFRSMMKGLKEFNNPKKFIEEKDYDLFNFVIKQMDLVHSDIGHGAGRYDLAKIYLG